MDGLEAVELKLSEVLRDNHTFRFDSEFVRKDFLENIKRIKNYPKGFTCFNKIIDEITGGATPLGADYPNAGVIFLRVQNIMQNYFDLNDVVFISKEDDNFLKRSRLKLHDVLLTITGVSYGKSATVPQQLVNANINQHSVRIQFKKGVNPFYASTFLNSHFGKLQSDKNVVGVTRPALDYEAIKKFIIPNLSIEFQDSIERVILNANDINEQSENIYQQAETLLLNELGLHNWQPTQANTEVKSFKNSFLQSGRLDAEYYQPKYDEVEFAIRNNAQSYATILDIRLYNGRGLQPEYYEDGDLDIINSKHILDSTLDYNNFERTQTHYWDKQERARVYKNDILTYTTGANIGRTHVYLSEKKALASNHVNILRIKNENPIYVAFVMNSILGKLQTEKLSAGSAQQELYSKDIDNFLIPLIKKEAKKIICNNILKSLELKKQSAQLLQTAKQAVEIAIEEGEDTALKFMETN